MVFDTDIAVVELERRAILPIDAGGMRIDCRRGRVWITVDHGDDIVLEAGESFDACGASGVIVQALRDAVIAVRARDRTPAAHVERLVERFRRATGADARIQGGRPNRPAW